MVGSAICRALKACGCQSIITTTRADLDLCSQQQVEAFYADKQIDYVIIAAAKVGGIYANSTFPADFIYDNLMIQNNLIHGAWRAGVKRLLFHGSSCIYPRITAQPIGEDQLLAGKLEPTNEPYAIAKIAGIKMCESYNRQHKTDYRTLMPTNLYGPGDYFHPQNSHVIPALIRRFHEAACEHRPDVLIWGDGRARRDFLHVDDLAAACIHIMSLEPETYWQHIGPMNSHINVGSGKDMTIAECAQTIADAFSFTGEIRFDTDMPDGTPRKLLDISMLQRLGWQPSVDFATGIRSTCRWFQENLNNLRT